MVPTPAARTLQRANAVFGLDAKAYLLVEVAETGREEDLVRVARSLEAALADSRRFGRVEHALPVDPRAFVDALLLPSGPLYFEPDRLRTRLSRGGMEETLERQLSRLSLMGLGEAEAWVERDPLELHRPLLRRVRSLEGTYRFQPGRREYLSEDGRALLVTVEGGGPRGGATGGMAGAVAELDAAVADVLAAPWADGITVARTGGAYLGEETERIVRDDLTRGVGGSLVLAALLLAFALRLAPWRVLALCLPTLWGVGAGLGLVAAVRPGLSVLSLASLSLLVGLGVDFTIHLAAAARSARAEDLPPPVAVLDAVRGVRGALALAALTSAGAFGAFLTSREAFLREMGLIVTFGLAACLVAALVLLPPLLDRALRARPDRRPARDLGVGRLVAWAGRSPGLVLVPAALLTLAAAGRVAVAPPTLEEDLRRIHARDSAPLAAQERIGEVFGGSTQALTILLEAPSEAEVVAAAQRLDRALHPLLADGSLVARTSIAALLPPAERQAAVVELLRSRDPAAVAADLEAALDAVGFDPAAFAGYRAGLRAAVADPEPVTVARLEALGLGSVVRQLVRVRDGRAYALVAVYPRDDLWVAAQRDALIARLEAALARADAEGGLTGLAVASAEASALVGRDFGRIALLTVLAVVAVMVLRFRRPVLVLLVLLPAGLGALWTAAAASALGHRLNVMNLGVLPMILAIGIDDGIHLLHRYRSEGRGRGFDAAAAGVLITSLTTMVAFGSLALSRNQGIASVGVLSVLGVGACLLASVTVLPAALTVWRRGGGGGGRVGLTPERRAPRRL